VEVGRRDTDHGERDVVEFDAAPNNGGIAGKLPPPETIGWGLHAGWLTLRIRLLREWP